ncbi:MAG: nucleotidyltransferase family protein [Dialister invisus]|uniref:nucleotidyltransferase family protein n=1 Tax=Dialister invisus TaxID=218538 RepID=UPI0039963A48
MRDSRLFSEGLENKWYKEIQQASLPDVFEAIKSKRYLYSRLKRIAASLLLSSELVPSPLFSFLFPQICQAPCFEKHKKFYPQQIKSPCNHRCSKSSAYFARRKSFRVF